MAYFVSFYGQFLLIRSFSYLYIDLNCLNHNKLHRLNARNLRPLLNTLESSALSRKMQLERVETFFSRMNQHLRQKRDIAFNIIFPLRILESLLR